MTPEHTIELIAQTVHEALRAYCISIGDRSQLEWGGTPPENQEVTRNGVRAVIRGVDPETSHELWCEFKRKDGWVYGPHKDLARQTHPCIVPYAELPQSERKKDEIFVAIVRAMMGVL